MADRTAIEWTDATWNPVTGCTRVSTGCDNCYASTMANRLCRKIYLDRLPVVESEEARRDPFAVRLWPERLDQPLNWRKSRKIFPASMSDLFHADIPDDYVRDAFEVMVVAGWHIYQILTKRPARALRFYRRNRDLFDGGELPPHIWIGTTVENQAATSRIRHLVSIPAQVRFISCEPLLGPLDLDLDGIHWVIAGGESGSNYRPIQLDWVRLVRDQCISTDTPFFFKQIGGRTPKSGGCELDGREWKQWPEIASDLIPS
jgi:protein gp37